MKNFFSRIAIGGILTASAIFAASMNDFKVSLPHAVTVGATTLPGGDYTISPMETGDGNEFFVVRGKNIAPVVLAAQKIQGATAVKTQVTLSETGDTWRFDKLAIEGDTTAFEFSK